MVNFPIKIGRFSHAKQIHKRLPKDCAPMGKNETSWDKKFQEVKRGMITMEKWVAISQLNEEGFGKRTITKKEKPDK